MLASGRAGPYECIMNKQEMRAAMKALMGDIPPEDLATRSGRVTERLGETEEWKRADTVLCFLSMPHELSTQAIIENARAERKIVAVPCMEAADIYFLIMPADTGALTRDRWGIPVPDPRWARLDLRAAADILVATPGLAFDREGNRLGRGKGYYDRFLLRARGEARAITAIGVCLSEQVLVHVPHEEHDQPLDGIGTEKETRLMSAARS